jgi:hypothetical protein
MLLLKYCQKANKICCIGGNTYPALSVPILLAIQGVGKWRIITTGTGRKPINKMKMSKEEFP